MIGHGFCIGASSISYVKYDSEAGHASKSINIPHGGSPQEVFLKTMKERNIDPTNDRICITGRTFKESINLTSISEAEAIETAYSVHKQAFPDIDMIVSGGGESFFCYVLNNKGKIKTISTLNKCASGTGEFFMQQLKRMDVNINEIEHLADMESPYSVADRCSVFCKSDCTHALNKGIPKGRVIAGLARMMSGKILELVKKHNEAANIMLVGGVSRIKPLVSFLKHELPLVAIPEDAVSFEALGAAVRASELDNTLKISFDQMFDAISSRFNFLPKLSDYIDKADFKTFVQKSTLSEDLEYYIGLDVGSTTTKAVVMGAQSERIYASTYLRTNGDPVGASRRCYQELLKMLPASTKMNIIAVGVTGSGRMISGLHAQSKIIVNEIIAHAKAASYFDPEVDTILEIGGQDAKYTYLTSGVPSDYAMNEACSAGTGSFLEEAVKESFGIEMTQIADYALRAGAAPNFSTQCAAFISSDIKTAVQAGISVEDIVSGLVYSVCRNYLTRVKGNRQLGRKIFMQGGVCYNKAVPIAMAAILGAEVIIPPEPGLMGAFGVALVAREHIERGSAEKSSFDLEHLASREVTYGKTFNCAGEKGVCKLNCPISIIEVEGKKFAFGGACSKYGNLLVNHTKINDHPIDLIARREEIFFAKQEKAASVATDRRIAVLKSLMSNTLYPLYKEFFSGIGYETILINEPSIEGFKKKDAAFCYPVELSHGFLQQFLNSGIKNLFLPHIKRLPGQSDDDPSVTCPLVQSEPYVLKSAFPELKTRNVLSPVINMRDGYEGARQDFIEAGKRLGCEANAAAASFDKAVHTMRSINADMKQSGRDFLKQLDDIPGAIGIVVFGRTYNSLASEANKAIPRKFSSRGLSVIPAECLPFEDMQEFPNMYWATGHSIVKAARFTAAHPNLFGVYITNFSCGPDSFILNYFREIMGSKPSLTLELDSHSADAGLDTRIEAFLDVVEGFRHLQQRKDEAIAQQAPEQFIDRNFMPDFSTKSSKKKPVIIFPSMGRRSSRMLSASFQGFGFETAALDDPTEADAQKGRLLSTCKECLPFTLTVGSIINYLEKEKLRDDFEQREYIYFMPMTSGPCRFGQYYVLTEIIIKKLGYTNVKAFSLTSESGYSGLPASFLIKSWLGMLLNDMLDDMYNNVLLRSSHNEGFINRFEAISDSLIEAFTKGDSNMLWQKISEASNKLSEMNSELPEKDCPKILLIGEIYVRRDDYSRQFIVDKLIRQGFKVRVAPIHEWVYYCDWLVMNGLTTDSGMKRKMTTFISMHFKQHYEKKIKKIFAATGLCEYEEIEINKIIQTAQQHLSPELTGEAILGIGSAINEIDTHVDGIALIGPFGCMPTRIAEAVLSKQLENKAFLAIETDGNVFPPIIEAKIESFLIQTERAFKNKSKHPEKHS